MKKYAIRDREAGNIISRTDDLEEALEMIEAFEADDRDEEIYTENFYEIAVWNENYKGYLSLYE